MSSRPRIWLWLLFAVVAGCATAERRGDQLMERGDFLAAADAYDEALDEDADNAKLWTKRDDARGRALDGWLLEARQRRAQGRTAAAVAKLEVALSHQRTWQVKLPPGTQRTLREEIAAATADVRREITALTGTRRPLAAQAALAKHRPLFARPELAAVGNELADEVRDAGQASCRALRATLAGEMPYWHNLTATYCTHFGVATPAVARPLQAAAVAVNGAVHGVDAALDAAIKAHVGAAFGRTVWFDPAATSQPLPATMAGRLDERRGARPVSLSAPWTEQIPYTATETYQEPYTEYYGVYESHLVSVPHTTSQSYTYSCGSGTSYRTCTGYRSVTSSRLESRSQYVTKSRMAYHTRTRMVTRYRSVARVFSFVATEHVAEYRVDAEIALALPGVTEPLRIRWAGNDVARGLEHAVTFQPAGVFPATPDLPSGGDWLSRRLPALGAQVTAALNGAWASSFCGQSGSTLEEAARCAYGAEPSAWTLAVFATATGDEPKALARFARGAP